MRHPYEGITGNFHRLQKAFTRALRERTVEILFRGGRDRVERKIELSPGLLRDSKYILQLPRHSHVARLNNGRFESLGERLDKWSCLVIGIRYRNVGTETAERLSATIGDGMLVCDTENNRFLSG